MLPPYVPVQGPSLIWRQQIGSWEVQLFPRTDRIAC